MSWFYVVSVHLGRMVQVNVHATSEQTEWVMQLHWLQKNWQHGRMKKGNNLAMKDYQKETPSLA